MEVSCGCRDKALFSDAEHTRPRAAVPTKKAGRGPGSSRLAFGTIDSLNSDDANDAFARVEETS
jgi:hypothetical protein